MDELSERPGIEIDLEHIEDILRRERVMRVRVFRNNPDKREEKEREIDEALEALQRMRVIFSGFNDKKDGDPGYILPHVEVIERCLKKEKSMREWVFRKDGTMRQNKVDEINGALEALKRLRGYWDSLQLKLF